MKKFILSLVLMGFGFSANAQEQSSDDFAQNEVSLNLLRTVLSQFVDVSYERVLQEDIGVGTNLGFSFAKDEMRSMTLFQMTPFVNWYFGGNTSSTKKYASGFFLQANVSLNTQKSWTKQIPLLYGKNESSDIYTTEEIKSTNFGAGFAIGWKYVSKNNWVGTVCIGGGKNLYKSYESSSLYTYSGPKNPFNFYLNTGISIGKRF